MKVLIDTPIWSLVLRRRNPDAAVISELSSLMEDDRIAIIGPIRQELLSGAKDKVQFERLRNELHDFPDTEIASSDYEEAASFSNECRRHGIQGSHIDFLICAVAVRNDFPIFTTDGDFAHFARVLPITLYDS
ncbi:MAG TPA: PIN domain-containing protein [Thermoanaerobaculia bacterium]|jgi:predicted nucleic acid-binding protein